MKRLCLIIVLLVAVAALNESRAVSSASALRWQDPGGQQKGEEKEKDEPPKISGVLGTKTNPVRCDAPRGERQYLSRLRCDDGNGPAFSRIGSFGFGPYGNIIDGYRVKCEGRAEETVFMDMYHEGYVEKEAVPGFTIID